MARTRTSKRWAKSIRHSKCEFPARSVRRFPAFGRSRCAGNGSDHGPVVLVHNHGSFRLRPKLNGDVVDAVAEDTRLDGQVAHAFAQALLSPNRAPLDHYASRLTHTLEYADLCTKRVDQGHLADSNK